MRDKSAGSRRPPENLNHGNRGWLAGTSESRPSPRWRMDSWRPRRGRSCLRRSPSRASARTPADVRSNMRATASRSLRESIERSSSRSCGYLLAAAMWSRADRRCRRRRACSGRCAHQREPDRVGSPRHRGRVRSDQRAGARMRAPAASRSDDRRASGDLAPVRSRAGDSKVRGFTASFRMFCLASAGLERPNQAFVVDAVAEQMTIMLQGLDALEPYGFRFPNRRVPSWPPKRRPHWLTGSPGSSGNRRSPEPGSTIPTTTLACAFRLLPGRRHPADRRRRVRLGGEAHVESPDGLCGQRPGFAAGRVRLQTPVA